LAAGRAPVQLLRGCGKINDAFALCQMTTIGIRHECRATVSRLIAGISMSIVFAEIAAYR